ncbi:hypothetical protein CWS02_23515 [Enterobacter sp. EA-1]|nr:hypothetical protein CWS02_23515 [Enterobacter sp. EA-1]
MFFHIVNEFAKDRHYDLKVIFRSCSNESFSQSLYQLADFSVCRIKLNSTKFNKIMAVILVFHRCRTTGLWHGWKDCYVLTTDQKT